MIITSMLGRISRQVLEQCQDPDSAAAKCESAIMFSDCIAAPPHPVSGQRASRFQGDVRKKTFFQFKKWGGGVCLGFFVQ